MDWVKSEIRSSGIVGLGLPSVDCPRKHLLDWGDGTTMCRRIEIFGVVLLILCAGCIGGTGSPPSTSTTTPPTPSNWSAPSGEAATYLDTTPFRNLSVGNRTDLPKQYEHHSYVIKNNQSESRSVSVTVWRDTEIVLNRTLEFPAEGVLNIDAYRRGEYTVVIEPANASRAVYKPPENEWDCNQHTHNILVQPDGQLNAVTIQTLLGCP